MTRCPRRVASCDPEILNETKVLGRKFNAIYAETTGSAVARGVQAAEIERATPKQPAASKPTDPGSRSAESEEQPQRNPHPRHTITKFKKPNPQRSTLGRPGSRRRNEALGPGDGDEHPRPNRNSLIVAVLKGRT